MKEFLKTVDWSSPPEEFDQGLVVQSIINLTHGILVDSSTVICWTDRFVILGVLGLFCCFYSIFDGKSC